ncbi:MAG: hypothetical protein U5O39_03480 [Gammaproteobacteria bacterium]|nr:hypothetical protein [Gammaproteobacteria bacterium]
MTPRSEPNQTIVNTIASGSPTTLHKSEVNFDWFPLDFLYSHSPVLAADLGEDVCRLYVPDLAPAKSCQPVFQTSDNCNGCHWSSVLQGNALPNMLLPPKDEKVLPNEKYYDVTPFGEWSASMMGLAGKDPIFLAQLSWEEQTHPEYGDQIPNFCLRCHQAGAQRQFHLNHDDSVDPAVILPPDQLPDDAVLFTTDHTLTPRRRQSSPMRLPVRSAVTVSPVPCVTRSKPRGWVHPQHSRPSSNFRMSPERSLAPTRTTQSHPGTCSRRSA